MQFVSRNLSGGGYRPLVVVISGPSGSGKSTLLNRLFAENPGKLGYSVSHTTRNPRPGEQDGINYHFVSRGDFEELVKQNEFIEHAEFSGNLYGTSVKAVKDVEKSGKLCILDIELNGLKIVKQKRDELDARFLFVAPPSLEVLEKRLRGRDTETEESINARLDAAKTELAYAKEEGAHDLIIVNDDLEVAYQKFKKFIIDTYVEKFGE